MLFPMVICLNVDFRWLLPSLMYVLSFRHVHCNLEQIKKTTVKDQYIYGPIASRVCECWRR